MATATYPQPPPQRTYGPHPLFSPILLASHNPASTSAAETYKQVDIGTFFPDSVAHASPPSSTTAEGESSPPKMSAPIPISPSSPSRDTYPSPSSASASSGMSPHTPFTPLPPSITPASVGTANGTNSGSGLLRWASLSFGKSPHSPSNGGHFGTAANPRAGHGQTPSHVHVQGHDHDHDEHHDVFEFGDFNHMAKGSWTGHGRRAASMSMASGANAGGRGAGNEGGGVGIGNEQSLSAMLSGGFGGPPSPMQEVGQGQGMNIPRLGPAGSPPGAGFRGGVVADNAAKGAGVLRRLSLTGSLTRPSFLSPPGQTTPLPPQPSITTSLSPGPSSQAQIPVQPQGSTMGQPQASALTSGKPAAAVDEGGAGAGGLRVPLGQRGRRYSENSARKRGVSPMGERILRDHGGF